MKRILVLLAALTFVASPSHSQEPTALEITAAICIGPGFIPDGDPFEIFALAPEKSCIKACKAIVKGCKAVVKAYDKCGKSFLKASAKAAGTLCTGLGGSKDECRPIKDNAKADIASWLDQGRIEKSDCVFDGNVLCFNRC